MTEIIIGEKFSGEFNKIYPKPKVAKITGIVTDSHMEGVEGTKYLISANLHFGQKSKEAGSMFLKKLDNIDVPWESYTSPEEIIEKYYLLKKHGFPVVPTMRLDTKHNQIIMTDLSQSGKFKIFDKHTKLRRGYEVSNKNDLAEQARQIAKEAYDGGFGVLLDYDAYCVVVDPITHIGKLYLSDLGLGSHRLKNQVAVGGRKYPISEAENEVNQFIEFVLGIKESQN